MVNPKQLAAAIAEASLLRGDFVLRSGRRSSYYLDKYRFSTRPEILGPVAELFGQRIGAIAAELGPIHRLAGAELGGIPLVTATSLKSGLPCVFVRNQKKGYGTAKQLEGDLHEGDRVVLLEDVATTGGQALEAVGVIRAQSADVAAVIAAIDRQEGARENIERDGIRFEALFTKSDLGIDE
ncbi:MAG: orotate phosphoribosyltransferase [Phycisphaeraceae bacterium]|nr:orotate phosphoribosyltransferase [Phycisphaeraceae bacterium]